MKIEKNYTAVGGIMYGFYVLCFYVFFGSLLKVQTTWHEGVNIFGAGFGVFGLFFVGWLVAISLRKRQIARRAIELRDLAAARNLQFTAQDIGLTTAFSWMSLASMRKAQNATNYNVIAGPDWMYSDFSYDIFRRTKGGPYKAVTNYYSVMTMQLPRSLPNVFFDSIKQRRRQFRFHFAKSQLHSLEGDFDKHFATYFPPEYTLDSMSFITPEVMWALREARDYDIEIIGDRIFLYGSLEDVAKQIDDMHVKLSNIKQKLLNNVVTYRDERLSVEMGRKRVTPMAMELKRSTFWKYTGFVIVGLYIFAQALPWLIRFVTELSD